MATIESRGGVGASLTPGGTYKVAGGTASDFSGEGGGGGGGPSAAGGRGTNALGPAGGGAGADASGASIDGGVPIFVGGNGGDGAPGFSGAGGGGGGGGGSGFVSGSSGPVTVTVAARGGKGGVGGSGINGTFGDGGGGGGGSGGYGEVFTAAAQVITTANLTGGTGGNGGAQAASIFRPSAGGDGGGGAYFGQNAGGASFTVVNATVSGGQGGAGASTGGAGVVMLASGTVTNGGTLQGGNGRTGGVGAALNGGGSVSNTNLIQGGNGDGSGSGGAGVAGSNLTVDASVAGSRIAGGFANLNGTGQQADAVTYLGGIDNFLTLGAGTLSGGVGVSGLLNVANGGTSASVSLVNTVHDGPNGAGSLAAFSFLGGGTNLTLSGANTYTGGTFVTEGSTLTLNGPATYAGNGSLQSAAAGTGAISFTSGTAVGRLVLPLTAQPTAANTTFSNTISNFNATSQLDLAGLTGAMVSYNSTNSQLTVTGTSGGANVTQTYRLTLADPAQAGNFQTQSDGNGGTLVTLCFGTGTRIRTVRGEVAVEALRVGDRAVTASGHSRPITWIGHRALEAAGKPLPHDQQPVRIRAGAFGHDASGRSVPARDLRLSPGHPVLVGADADSQGGSLVPVMSLLNGTTITRETSATTVTYWHVELDAHDILLAEGLPAESYYDMGSRVWFAGRDGALIDMDFVPAGAHGRCRPVAVAGAVVEAEHRRLDGVFAAYLAAQCAWREPAVA